MPSFQVPVLGFADGFLSPFPDSLPQLFLRCLPYALAFGLSPSNPLPFVRFSSGSGYLASASSFPLSSCLRLTVASSVRPLRSRFLGSPRSLRPGFPCLLSRFFVLGFLFVSFRPSLIRSHSCSSGAYLMLSLSVFSASVPLPFVRFPSASGYLAFCFFLSSFFLSPPHSGFLSAPSPLSLPWLSPFLPTWFPMSSLPVLRTRLSVRFLSSFPVSLPQPFHRCFPPALAFGLSPSLPFSFVHFRSGSNYSAFRSFLSLLPVLP